LQLLSWNVAGRVTRQAEQGRHVLALAADVVCLQEVTARTLPAWREQLSSAGYTSVHGAELTAGARPRPLGVLTACREAAEPLALADMPWAERVLAVRTTGGLEVTNVHVPISPAPELAKVRTLEAVFAHLARRSRRPRILCGDLNTPRREHPDGSVWTFARDRYGRLRPERGERWDAAELLLIRDLQRFGFRDAYRSLHGHEEREISWSWARWRGGYRLDHLLVAGLAVEQCHYEHAWREQGLSDHSPLVARLRGAAARRAASRTSAGER
jgi:exonuclease III